MNILIKFPTRGRPDKFLVVLDRYIEYLDDSNTRFIITCDDDDITMKQPYVLSVLNKLKNISYSFGNSKSKIEAVNADIVDDDFDILLLASDDMIPVVKGFDSIIKSRMTEMYPDTDGVLWFNDGHQGRRLNTLCILGRKYYKRFNYIYYPEYKSGWCDNEFMDVANMLGKQTYFDDVIIEHQHPCFGYGSQDNIHRLNTINNSTDRDLYLTRRKNNFK